MVDVLLKDDEIVYESGEDLMNNNADDGASKAKLRDKFEERSEQVNKIKAGLNEEAAADNIAQAQQSLETKYIIDPITGEVIEAQGSDGELSVAAIVGLLERGASEEEIEAELGAAITSIMGSIARDKRKAKKHLAELLELLHVIETVFKQSGQNVDLQNSLREMQTKVSKLLKDGNVKQIQEFLQSSQLKEVLTKSVQASRDQITAIKGTQQAIRELGRQAKEANLPREVALKQLQEASKDILKTQLNQSLNALKEAYETLSKEFAKETDPAKKEAIKEAIKEVAKQAKEIQNLQRETNGKEVTSKQFEQVQKVLKSQLERTTQLAQTLNLSANAAKAMNTLAGKQQNVLKTIDSRLLTVKQAEKSNALATQRSNLNNLSQLNNLQLNPAMARAANQTLQPLQKTAELKPAQAKDQLLVAQKMLAQEKNPTARQALQTQIKQLNRQVDLNALQQQRDAVKVERAEQKVERTEQRNEQRATAQQNTNTAKAVDNFAKDTSNIKDVTAQFKEAGISTNGLQQAQKDLQTLQTQTAELAKGMNLTPAQQKSLSGLTDFDQKKFDQLVEKGDLKAANKMMVEALKDQTKQLQNLKSDITDLKESKEKKSDLADHLKMQQRNEAKTAPAGKNGPCDPCTSCGNCGDGVKVDTKKIAEEKIVAKADQTKVATQGLKPDQHSQIQADAKEVGNNFIQKMGDGGNKTVTTPKPGENIPKIDTSGIKIAPINTNIQIKPLDQIKAQEASQVAKDASVGLDAA